MLQNQCRMLFNKRAKVVKASRREQTNNYRLEFAIANRFMDERYILSHSYLINTKSILELVIVLGPVHPDSERQTHELVHGSTFVEIPAGRSRAFCSR